MSPGSKNSDLHENVVVVSGKSNLWLRARIIQAIRDFFVDRGYLEVETPYLIPAPTPETHIDPIETEGGFLHTSPELCMKRLLSSGYRKIFQICKSFRRGERGAVHLPEFTILEWYRAGIDYRAIMEECEEMIWGIAHLLSLGKSIGYRGNQISLERPWVWMSVCEAFELYSSSTMEEALSNGMFHEIMAREIEPRLGIERPVFLYDYPGQLAALSQIKKDDPRLAERAELYLGGLELANAFTELTDPEEQRRRFESVALERKSLGKPVHPFPEKFITALSSMPGSAGIALGVDRLVMVFADRADIGDVVTFTPEEL
ncbi:MAG: EF-P lysine aminoacylase GenX [Deltaproteobacteria bacterium]|nr:EF-P lysine aminoacylase GenX [Deltaproteobacteria bacterium]